MIDQFLETQAAVYVSGAMTAQEREQFELVLEFHEELRALVSDLADMGTLMALATFENESVRPRGNCCPASKAWSKADRRQGLRREW